MPDVASVLKQEIRRLAKKEIMLVAADQSRQIRGLKATVRDLRKQVADLGKTVTRTLAASRQQSPTQTEPEEKSIRISARSIRSHRKRLGLTQAQLSKLLGVSTASVTFWESGRTSPRGKNRQAIAELRTIGSRDAKVLLESL